jgi:hypothetical protein
MHFGLISMRGMRRVVVLTVVVLVCGNVLARDVAQPASKDGEPANAAAKSVNDEAQRILKSIKSTEYKHTTAIDEAKGQYYCDCSGFVGYVLNQTVAKDNPKGGPLGNGKKRPLAMDYEKTFAKAPTKADGTSGWQKVERVVDARPGDVIAWRHDEPKPGNTGHVVIVAQVPVVEEDGMVRVVIIDSTTKPHVDDTRKAGTSGIGRCTMWFTVDDEGRPKGTVRGARTAEPKVEPISIGRAVPASEKELKRAA